MSRNLSEDVFDAGYCQQRRYSMPLAVLTEQSTSHRQPLFYVERQTESNAGSQPSLNSQELDRTSTASTSALIKPKQRRVSLGDQLTGGAVRARQLSEETFVRRISLANTNVTESPKTLVSFYVDEEDDKEKKKEEKKHRGFSRSVQISSLYAVILVLVGLVFPVTEALKDSWYTHHVVAIYMVYLFLVSTAFIIYIEVLMGRQRRREGGSSRRHQREEGEEAGPTQYSRPTPREEGRSSPREEGKTSGGQTQYTGEAGEGGQAHRDTGQDNPAYNSAGDGRLEKQLSVLVEHDELGTKTDEGSRNIDNTLSTVVKKDDKTDDGTDSKAGLRQRVLLWPTGSPRVRSVSMSTLTDADEEVVEYMVVSSTTGTQQHDVTSFYLRIATVFFAIANLLYIGLEVESNERMWRKPECPTKPARYPPYFHLIFIVSQSFFLFKNPMLLVKKQKRVVRFALMHLLATNLCVWVRILVREVMEAVHEYQHQDKPHPAGLNVDSVETLAMVVTPSIDLNTTNETKVCYDDSLLHQASPYLFPFVLEFSLIAMATYAAMFESLNILVSKNVFDSIKKSLAKNPARQNSPRNDGNGHQRHHHAPNNVFEGVAVALLLGVLIVAGFVVTIVIYFFWRHVDGTETGQNAVVVHSANIGSHALALVATLSGLIKICRLSYSIQRNNMIDQLLVAISMAGLFILELFNMVSGFYFLANATSDAQRLENQLDVTASIIVTVQAVGQTVFIVDGMQRFSSTPEHQQKKPGRSEITFLLVVNIGLWLFKSFLFKKVALAQHRYFYGDVAWPIIVNICLPLTVFFRFHSSVCLAHMWSHTYENEEEHEELDYTLIE